MRRRLALLAALVGGITLVGAAGAATPAPATGSDAVHVAPVTRLPFPERGYVVSVPESRALDARSVVVRENGVRVTGVRVDPLAGSGLRYGVVLALDASESMTGGPAAAALEAGRTFLAHRSATEEIGIVAFNGEISVLSDLTKDGSALRRTLETQPPLAYGTRIHDAITRSLGLLRDAKLSSGSIVLLSDGADIGSLRTLEQAVAAAKEQQVRVFTVGLRSGAFDAAPLRSLAERTGGSYAEARSAAELARDLRGARHPARGRVPRPLPLGRAPDVAGGGPDRGRQGRRGGHGVCRADAVAAGAVPPLTGLDVPALGRLAARARALLRAARVRAVAAADPSAEDDGRRPRRELLEPVRAVPRPPTTRPTWRCARPPATAMPPDGGRSSSAISSWRG